MKDNQVSENSMEEKSEETIDKDRRHALEMIKKTAIYTPPVIASLLLIDRKKATAMSL